MWNVCLKVSCCELNRFKFTLCIRCSAIVTNTKMRNNVNFAFRLIGFTLLLLCSKVCNTIKPFYRRLFTWSFVFRLEILVFVYVLCSNWLCLAVFSVFRNANLQQQKYMKWNFFHDILLPRAFSLYKTTVVLVHLYIGCDRRSNQRFIDFD